MELLSLKLNELEEMLTLMNEPKFRAKQLFDWLHVKRVTDFSEMLNLPKTLREKLSAEHSIAKVSEAMRQTSQDGTVKFLYELEDGNTVETVAMDYERGISLCVSTEVGCRMGCRFCISTKGGLIRKLSAGEILGQVYASDRILGKRINSVVMMGIGEPLDNYDASVRFIELVTDPNGYNMAGRNVSLSTCGLVPEIERLAELKLPITLSLSLHAANDEKRNRNMPVNRIYPVHEAVSAAIRYSEITGRRVSYEYAIIHGWNDTDEDADQLKELLKGTLSHLNLIPINSAGDKSMHATRDDAYRFQKKMIDRGINTTVRRTLGSDIDAACGQLRSRKIKADEVTN